LIGHATLFETRTEAAIQAFARFAQNCPHAHMILGEQEKVERFWEYYSASWCAPRRVCRELLFEQRRSVAVYEVVRGLRLATLDDLALVMPAHAEMALEEGGVNPLEVDPLGFRQRCARRIERERVWVWVEQGQLIFKADIVADTSEVIYLEGVYVSPPERGRSSGSRCLSQMSRQLLERTNSICLLVNEQNWGAQAFYHKAGYRLRSYYDTIFLQQRGKTDAGIP
jgi:ribosomal protein S18 acetylase RimI-like enzyme